MIAPGAARQFSMADLETALPAGTAKPIHYATTIKPEMSGFFQHVLFRPNNNALANLTMCEASTSANATTLINVHSSLLDDGYPSSVAITNTGTRSISVRLGIFDARDGRRLGTYQSSPISANAQAVVTVAEMQAGAGVTPPTNAFHYVIKAESEFTGFLQHLINNQRAGTITDVTAMCAFGALPTPVATEALRYPGPLFSSAQANQSSMLGIHNTGTAAGTVHVTLLNNTNGVVLGRWTSPTIPAGAAPQFPMSEIETGLTPGVSRPQMYSAFVETQIDGTLQNLLVRTTDGSVTNASTCNAAVGANGARVANVRASASDARSLSWIVIANAGGASATATLGVFDAATGNRLGTYTSAPIAAGGQLLVTAAGLESGAGLEAGGSSARYVIALEGTFRGFLQHLVDNQSVGILSEMTATCQLPARSLSYTDCSAGFTSACPMSPGSAERAGQIKKNSGFEFYRLTLTQGRTYTIDAKGADTQDGTLVSPYIFVHRADFTVAEQGSNGGTGRNANLSFTPPTDGTYYIVVTGSTLTSNGIVVAHPSGTYKISIR